MDTYYHLQNYSECMHKISEEHLIFFLNSNFMTFPHIDGSIFKNHCYMLIRFLKSLLYIGIPLRLRNRKFGKNLKIRTI